MTDLTLTSSCVSFFDMMNKLLEYRHKKRISADEILDHEFLQFHKVALSVEQIAIHASQNEDQATDMTKQFPRGRTTSVSLRGSVGRHSMFLDYQKYQRSLTTLLATLLNKTELAELVRVLSEFLSKDDGSEVKVEVTTVPGIQGVAEAFSKKLDVMHLRELKAILREQKHDQVYVRLLFCFGGCFLCCVSLNVVSSPVAV
jgi:hypothetical protein